MTSTLMTPYAFFNAIAFKYVTPPTIAAFTANISGLNFFAFTAMCPAPAAINPVAINSDPLSAFPSTPSFSIGKPVPSMNAPARDDHIGDAVGCSSSLKNIFIMSSGMAIAWTPYPSYRF